MNPEWVRKFVELVKTNAPIKAYQKRLGLTRSQLKYHLGRLAEYEASLSAPQEHSPVEKKVEKVHSILDAITKRFDSEIVEADELEFEELEETEKEETEEENLEDENGEAL